MRGLEGKVAFVTGAASGIGRATAVRLGEEGARVAAADLNADGAAATASAIGPEAVGLGLDITDLSSVQAAVAEAERLLGPIEILVNCAGWDRVEPFLDSSEETWDRIIDVNLKGVIRCTRSVLDGMISRRSGRIVNVSSDAGRVGSSGEVVYSGAKAGIIGFSKGVARETARHGLRVNVVCPGPTDTPLMAATSEANPRLGEALVKAIPFRRLAKPEEIAAAIAFLASDDASFITGQTLSVSGGLTMV
ncbi:MAG: SDR family oxidoreductase [Candidatus Dormibacteraeota bacterium]|jgi:2-hydroxycyclohexanecarboxyl-CoA dehydrogenase|nr:SDR family oxidoreductase [Candidatus Dormibacteraeota bacterium]